MENNRYYNQLTFGVLFASSMLIIICGYLPYLHYIYAPLSYVGTYFHEISHALTCFLTGGHLKEMVVDVDGGGHCLISHHSSTLWMATAYSGYLGASVFGALIFLSDRIFKKHYLEFKGIFLGLIFVSFFYLKFDAYNFLTVGIVAILFFVAFFQKSQLVETLFMKFTGMVVMLHACLSPSVLFGQDIQGDEEIVSYLSGFSENAIINSWTISCSLIFFISFSIEYAILIKEKHRGNSHV